MNIGSEEINELSQVVTNVTNLLSNLTNQAGRATQVVVDYASASVTATLTFTWDTTINDYTTSVVIQ